MAEIEAGDRVALVEDDGTTHVVRAEGDPRKVPDLGVLDPRSLVGHPWGQATKVGQRRVVPLPVRPVDAMRSADRGPQIVQPKDAAQILLELGVGPGDRVLEIGSGSGVLTLALAGAVGPSGRVVSLDRRADHLAVARRNVERSGVDDRVRLVRADGSRLPVASGFDAATLDVPDPETLLGGVADALRIGGSVAVYVPLVAQVEAARKALSEGPWVQPRTVEILERSWRVGPRGSRPDHDILGHTGFLTFARRVGENP